MFIVYLIQYWNLAFCPQCIYVLRMILRIKSNYFPKQY
jgi:hypothetical protein